MEKEPINSNRNQILNEDLRNLILNKQNDIEIQDKTIEELINIMYNEKANIYMNELLDQLKESENILQVNVNEINKQFK